MKSLLCAKVNSDRVWAQINAVMSGALCRRQKASFYNGLLCGLPTTSSGYFAQVWSFYFYKSVFLHRFFLLLGGIDGLTAVPGGAWGGGGRGWFPKFSRNETYLISRQGGAKLRGYAGCVIAASFPVSELHVGETLAHCKKLPRTH